MCRKHLIVAVASAAIVSPPTPSAFTLIIRWLSTAHYVFVYVRVPARNLKHRKPDEERRCPAPTPTPHPPTRSPTHDTRPSLVRSKRRIYLNDYVSHYIHFSCSFLIYGNSYNVRTAPSPSTAMRERRGFGVRDHVIKQSWTNGMGEFCDIQMWKHRYRFYGFQVDFRILANRCKDFSYLANGVRACWFCVRHISALAICSVTVRYFLFCKGAHMSVLLCRAVFNCFDRMTDSGLFAMAALLMCVVMWRWRAFVEPNLYE